MQHKTVEIESIHKGTPHAIKDPPQKTRKRSNLHIRLEHSKCAAVRGGGAANRTAAEPQRDKQYLIHCCI